jgi:hypothetical protein
VKLRFGLAFFSLLTAAPILAQTRPLLTEEATTPAAGSVSLEAGADFINAEPNYLTGKPRDRYAAPALRFTASPADNVQMDFEWVARVGAISDPDFGSTSASGDVTLRAKVRLRDAGPGRTALGARFGVTLADTHFGDGLGPNTLRMSAQLLLTHLLGPARLHANAGLALQDEPLRAHQQRDFVAFGIAGEIPVGRRVTALGEIAGNAGNGAPGADQHVELRGGVRVAARRLTWDVALRRGLTQTDGTWGFTAGLSYRIRPGESAP